MKQSDMANKIYAALAKAQGTINNPDKAAKNPHFGSNYADLGTGITAIREGLSANGIAFIQAVRVEGDLMMLDTRLGHSSGQFLECEWPVCKLPIAPQQMGSALTYARRYSLFSIVGIAGEDDDGNDAQHGVRGAPAHTPPKPSKPAPAFINDDQAATLSDIIKALGKGTWEEFSQSWRITRLGELQTSEFPVALAQLQARQALLKKSAAKTPPNPNAPPAATPIDYEAILARYREEVARAPHGEALDTLYEATFGAWKTGVEPDGYFDKIRDIDDARRGELETR